MKHVLFFLKPPNFTPGIIPGAWASAWIGLFAVTLSWADSRPPLLEGFSPAGQKFFEEKLYALSDQLKGDETLGACVIHIPPKKGEKDQREWLQIIDFTLTPAKVLDTFRGEKPDPKTLSGHATLLGDLVKAPSEKPEINGFNYRAVEEASKNGAFVFLQNGKSYSQDKALRPSPMDPQAVLTLAREKALAKEDQFFERSGPGKVFVRDGARPLGETGFASNSHPRFVRAKIYSIPSEDIADKDLKLRLYPLLNSEITQNVYSFGDSWYDNGPGQLDLKYLDHWSALKLLVLSYKAQNMRVCDITSDKFDLIEKIQDRLPLIGLPVCKLSNAHPSLASMIADFEETNREFALQDQQKEAPAKKTKPRSQPKVVSQPRASDRTAPTQPAPPIGNGAPRYVIPIPPNRVALEWATRLWVQEWAGVIYSGNQRVGAPYHLSDLRRGAPDQYGNVPVYCPRERRWLGWGDPKLVETLSPF